eukprot:11130956-Ditylum_brightwellii.AAC.1
MEKNPGKGSGYSSSREQVILGMRWAAKMKITYSKKSRKVKAELLRNTETPLKKKDQQPRHDIVLQK